VTQAAQTARSKLHRHAFYVMMVMTTAMTTIMTTVTITTTSTSAACHACT